MYHGRFKNTHYQAGFHWGEMLRKHGNFIHKQHTFQITEERKKFAMRCLPVYEKYYPEVLKEIKGIADGQQSSYEDLCTFLLSMYCFEFSNHCTCFAFRDQEHIVFGRNSDFLTELEKLYMNCLYQLDGGYSFQGNTTAFVQMEDGVNEYGLAVGLTFVYPKVHKAGLNAGMLVRYVLEKCRTTKEAIDFLQEIPIASQQILTVVDVFGDMAVVECNPYEVEVILPKDGEEFVVTANNYNSEKLSAYKNSEEVDDWNSSERYKVAYQALKAQNNHFSLKCAKEILSGKYGFMCQYDRKTGADTVWSVIYDVKERKIYRVEGNPARKGFKEDKRFHFRCIG